MDSCFKQGLRKLLDRSLVDQDMDQTMSYKILTTETLQGKGKTLHSWRHLAAQNLIINRSENDDTRKIKNIEERDFPLLESSYKW